MNTETVVSTEQGEINALRSVLKQILNDLPQRRDWLDPDLERQAKALVGMETAVYYAFTVRGSYPNGNKAKMQGHVKDQPGSPSSVFAKAVEACQAITPGLIVDLTKPGQVVVQQLRGKPK